MPVARIDDVEIAYVDEGAGHPVVLIHGFASSKEANWINTGWVKWLVDAGYRVIAFDNRGHGESSKFHDSAHYSLALMAKDAIGLIRHLDLKQPHVMGYSMGARVSAFMALRHPEKVATLILGGLGYGMVEGVGDWDPIAEALSAEDPKTISHDRGLMFRTFADQTKSDRKALAACISRSRDLLSKADAARITQPVLVAVGTTDDIAGSPHELAKLMPRAKAFDIAGRDHMLSVGDRTFKKRALEFLAEHPLA